MGAPYEPPRPDRSRRPHPEDPTVEFPKPPVPPRRPAPPPPRDEEPWWRNVNSGPGAQRPTYRPAAPLPPGAPEPRPPVRTPAPAPSPPKPARATAPKRSASSVWIAVGVGVVVVGGAALGVGLSGLNPVRDNVLDVSTVEDDVAAVLRDPVDGYGVYGLTDVTCNGGKDPAVIVGTEFRCEVIVDGRTRGVLAVFQDDAGTYAVDRPR